MASVTGPMQSLSLNDPSAAPQSQDDAGAKPQTRTDVRLTSHSWQVDPRPLPPMDEWLEVKADGGCMYYGFYADNLVIEKMLIAQLDKTSDRNPADGALLYLALMYLRHRFKRPDLSLHVARLPQRALDLNPSIEGEVDDRVLILGLFPLEKEAYLDRVSQEDADEIGRMMGMKPTWWEISELMDYI